MPAGLALANEKSALRTFREHAAREATDIAGRDRAKMSPKSQCLIEIEDDWSRVHLVGRNHVPADVAARLAGRRRE